METNTLFKVSRLWLIGAFFIFSMPVLFSSDWPSWRGPYQNGVSDETELISEWTAAGQNLIWRADFQGRSTPIVLNGRVYVIGRTGEGIGKQEVVACFDVRDGRKLWEHRFNVFLTTVPFPRVGWANLGGDPSTGRIYAHGVGGLFICFDRDGRVQWQHSLTESLGRMSGYGGRTHTPIIDGELVILSFVSSGWGDQAVPRHRYFAFDKMSGELVWVSTPGDRPYDFNTYSTPVVAMIKGQRLMIGGNADGAIEALNVHSGEPVWRFRLSKRGINSSVVVEGTRVFASHSEENLDESTMGRVVCIDATGTGDVTGTHEVWRYNQLKSGFPSPAVLDGRVYVMDNSANLHCLDAASGESIWDANLGTVGKGSPVLADGKLYITETNGTFHVLDVQGPKPQTLSRVSLEIGNRAAEIFSSPGIAYGRIFFVTEEGIYCLGSKDRPFEVKSTPGSAEAKRVREGGTVATLQVVPADSISYANEVSRFRVKALDIDGNQISADNVSWSVEGLRGRIDASGTFRPASADRPQTGRIRAALGDREGASRVRILPALPWLEDFESIEVGKTPPSWIGAAARFAVKDVENNRVLSKPFVRTGIQRSYVYIGKSDMSGVTIQADLLGRKEGRRVPDMGLVANRYAVALMGLRQELQVHSWVSELRMAKSVSFSWDPDVWYTMKVRVDNENDKAVVRAKVWPRDEVEPQPWTIEAEDPYPNTVGTPGLFGQSYAEILYDNVKVTKN